MTFELPDPDRIAAFSDSDDQEDLGFAHPEFASCWPLAAKLRALMATEPEPNPHLACAAKSPAFHSALDFAMADLAGYEAHLGRPVRHDLAALAALQSGSRLLSKAAERQLSLGFLPDQADAICAEAVARLCQRAMLDASSGAWERLAVHCAYPAERHNGASPPALLREFLLGQIGSSYFSLACRALAAPQGPRPSGFMAERDPPDGNLLSPPPLLAFCARASSALARTLQTGHAASHLSERDAHAAMAMAALARSKPSYPRGRPGSPAARAGRPLRGLEKLSALLERRAIECQSGAPSGSRSGSKSL